MLTSKTKALSATPQGQMSIAFAISILKVHCSRAASEYCEHTG
jgi:hypothetical protein